jgi:hypothetical protein
MSTSLKANGRLYQTSDKTDLACVHSPQPWRVNKVIRQDCRSLLVARMTVSVNKPCGQWKKTVAFNVSRKERKTRKRRVLVSLLLQKEKRT